MKESNPSPSSNPNNPLFTCGQVVATPGAIDALSEAHGNRWRIASAQLIARHRCGDWGITCPEDSKTNDWSVRHGARIISAYRLPEVEPGQEGTKLWIITEADRSATTILLPSEY